MVTNYVYVTTPKILSLFYTDINYCMSIVDVVCFTMSNVEFVDAERRES